MKKTARKISLRFLWICALMLLVIFVAACDEGAYGPPRKSGNAAAQPEDSAPARVSEPMLVVGDRTMPMPVPAGFRRLPVDNASFRATQLGLNEGEILLCMFEARSPASQEVSEAPARYDSVEVITLSKWQDLNLSSLEFLKLKQPWQEQAAVFNQGELTKFEEALRGGLSERSEFQYNLGLIDSGPLHVSFLRVGKKSDETASDYICSTTTLLWRHGKILRLSYNRHIESFGQIHAVVAESVGYIRQLQELDRNAVASGQIRQ